MIRADFNTCHWHLRISAVTTLYLTILFKATILARYSSGREEEERKMKRRSDE